MAQELCLRVHLLPHERQGSYPGKKAYAQPGVMCHMRRGGRSLLLIPGHFAGMNAVEAYQARLCVRFSSFHRLQLADKNI